MSLRVLLHRLLEQIRTSAGQGRPGGWLEHEACFGADSVSFAGHSRQMRCDVWCAVTVVHFVSHAIQALLILRKSLRRLELQSIPSKVWLGFCSTAERCADLHAGFCYPGHHSTRPFSTYDMGIREEDAKYADGAGSCTKQLKGHPTLLPGIFGVFCPHGLCLG
jgi:hypothetical protein